MSSLSEFLLYWRTTVTRGREIVEAVVRPDHAGPSASLQAALDAWPGLHYWGSRRDADRLVLIRVTEQARRERWWLHGILFLGTFLTVWMGGALLLGVSTRTLALPGPIDGIAEWVHVRAGAVPFAMALMGILLAHEMGHYFAAKRYRIDASPPFFLPAPVEFTFIGTFGAFIRLRSPIVDRRQLMDIGAAGPWAGFVVALLMLVVGLNRSGVAPPGAYTAPMVVQTANGILFLGDSLLTLGLRNLLVGDGTVILHQLAVAGWVGVLVTALNLLPLGQLDGGHIVYALLGDRQRALGIVIWIGLVAVGAFFFWPWLVWAGLILVLGGGRLAHPRVLERHRPLPVGRWPVGWFSVLLFLLTLSPVPILNSTVGGIIG